MARARNTHFAINTNTHNTTDAAIRDCKRFEEFNGS